MMMMIIIISSKKETCHMSLDCRLLGVSEIMLLTAVRTLKSHSSRTPLRHCLFRNQNSGSNPLGVDKQNAQIQERIISKTDTNEAQRSDFNLIKRLLESLRGAQAKPYGAQKPFSSNPLASDLFLHCTMHSTNMLILQK
eukprot:6473432-Amphidinium_carterae.1